MSKKPMVLGYTRSGHEVLLPTDRSADVERHFGWTRGDHLDAYQILLEHGDREQDDEVRAWCRGWSKAHRAMWKAGKSRRKRTRGVRGGAEVSIKVRGPR